MQPGGGCVTLTYLRLFRPDDLEIVAPHPPRRVALPKPYTTVKLRKEVQNKYKEQNITLQKAQSSENNRVVGIALTVSLGVTTYTSEALELALV